MAKMMLPVSRNESTTRIADSMAEKNMASGARSGMLARSSITSTLSSTPRRSAMSPVNSTARFRIGTDMEDSPAGPRSSSSAPNVSS